jgi:hypothetical protein
VRGRPVARPVAHLPASQPDIQEDPMPDTTTADLLTAAADKLHTAAAAGTPITLTPEAADALGAILLSKARVARFVSEHADQKTISGVGECCHVQLARAVLGEDGPR